MEALKDAIRIGQPTNDIITKAHRRGMKSTPAVSMCFDEHGFEAFKNGWVDSDDSDDGC